MTATANAALKPWQSISTHTRSPLVVCLDDDRSLLDAMAAYLGVHGFSVLTTSEPAVVMECLTTDMAAIVVLDCEMPGGSGLDLARTIRAMGFTLPLVMFTSRHIPPQERGDLNRVVPKGGSPDVLVKALREELEKSDTAKVAREAC